MTNIIHQGIITLIKSALSGEALPLPEGFSLEKAYPLIKRHRIYSICYCGAALCCPDEASPVFQKLQSQTYAEVIRGECQDWAQKKLYNRLREENLSFLPVKGNFIKKLYREPHMRYMADADVLIKPEERDKIEALLLEMGYRKYAESLCEIIYESDNLHLELHKTLIPPDIKDYYSYFKDTFLSAERIDGSRYKLRDENHFIYIFVHFARHYRGGGIGLKHLCDLYVCKTALALDYSYVEGELNKLGLLEFYKNVYLAIDSVFCGGEQNEITELIIDTVFKSGAYGTVRDMQLSTAARRTKKGNTRKAKRHHLWWVLFLPYGLMCIKYPFLKKVPFLLPFVWLWRALCALLGGSRRTMRQLKEVNDLSAEEILTFRDNLLRVGLDFNF